MPQQGLLVGRIMLMLVSQATRRPGWLMLCACDGVTNSLSSYRHTPGYQQIRSAFEQRSDDCSHSARTPGGREVSKESMHSAVLMDCTVVIDLHRLAAGVLFTCLLATRPAEMSLILVVVVASTHPAQSWGTKRRRGCGVGTGCPLPTMGEVWDGQIFSARQHTCYSALYAIARPSVRMSVKRVDQSKTVEVRIT